MPQDYKYTVSHEAGRVFVAPYIDDHTAARMAQIITADESNPLTESLSRDFTEDDGVTEFRLIENNNLKTLQVACKIAVTLASTLRPGETVRIK